MEKITGELNAADKKTKEAIESIEKATAAIGEKYHSITNIYTEGGSVTVERLGQAIENRIAEAEALYDVIDSLKKIINVKDAQIKLMLDALADDKTIIEKMNKKLEELEQLL